MCDVEMKPPADEGRLDAGVERLVPKRAKLSPAQLAMLRNASDGVSLFDGLVGRSEHGGAVWTMESLFRRGLLMRRGVGLTPAGAEALAACDKPPNV